jgi:hypothetical protein
MAHPQPGQKAALSGMEAAQSGQAIGIEEGNLLRRTLSERRPREQPGQNPKSLTNPGDAASPAPLLP